MRRARLLWLLCAIVVAFTACSSKQQCNYGNARQRAFFEFDKIDYYHYEIGDTNSELIDNNRFQCKHSLLAGFLILDEPSGITYTDLEKRLIGAGYIKRDIPQSQYPTFDSMFKEHCLNSIANVYSRNIYRDILVFGKGGKTTGVVKICFDATGWEYKIVGTDKDVSTFGQNGDIHRLEDLLYSLK